MPSAKIAQTIQPWMNKKAIRAKIEIYLNEISSATGQKHLMCQDSGDQSRALGPSCHIFGYFLPSTRSTFLAIHF